MQGAGVEVLGRLSANCRLYGAQRARSRGLWMVGGGGHARVEATQPILVSKFRTAQRTTELRNLQKSYEVAVPEWL